jgi:hypothetical protein
VRDVTLRDLLNEAAARFGTQSLAAEQIGVNQSRFSRVMQSASDKGESFEIATCLRLARALGRSPSEVLRVAGKSEEADLIEAMYGAAAQVVLSDEEHAIIGVLRAEPIDRATAKKLSLQGDAERTQALMMSTLTRFSNRVTEIRQVINAIEEEEEEAAHQAEVERQERRSKARWDRINKITLRDIREEVSETVRALEKAELLAWAEGEVARWSEFDARIEDAITDALTRADAARGRSQTELRIQLLQKFLELSVDRLQRLFADYAQWADVHRAFRIHRQGATLARQHDTYADHLTSYLQAAPEAEPWVSDMRRQHAQLGIDRLLAETESIRAIWRLADLEIYLDETIQGREANPEKYKRAWIDWPIPEGGKPAKKLPKTFATTIETIRPIKERRVVAASDGAEAKKGGEPEPGGTAMSRRRQRTIETLIGRGVLESDGKQLPVTYEVVVSVTELETMPNEWIDGLKKIEGSIGADDEWSLLGIHVGNGEATLHMEHDQHFDCFLSNVRGASGRLVARGNNRPEGSLYTER